MSIGTIAQEIIDDVHLLADSDTVYRKILSAMRFHREKRLWFSERRFQFSLVQGKASYGPSDGLPPDLTEIVGKTLWVLLNGSDDQRIPCGRVSRPEYEYHKQLGTSQSQPDSWYYFDRRLHLYPSPNSSTDILEGCYVTDIGVPYLRYESGAYNYYSPDGLTLLTSDEIAAFSNDWTEPIGAGHMIRTRATYLVYKEFLKDPDSANDFLTQWLEQVAVLEDETEARTAGAVEIEGTILGNSPLG